MTVKCPACGSTEQVTVGDKTYCTNCGAVVASVTPATTPATDAPATGSLISSSPTTASQPSTPPPSETPTSPTAGTPATSTEPTAPQTPPVPPASPEPASVAVRVAVPPPRAMPTPSPRLDGLVQSPTPPAPEVKSDPVPEPEPITEPPSDPEPPAPPTPSDEPSAPPKPTESDPPNSSDAPANIAINRSAFRISPGAASDQTSSAHQARLESAIAIPKSDAITRVINHQGAVAPEGHAPAPAASSETGTVPETTSVSEPIIAPTPTAGVNLSQPDSPKVSMSDLSTAEPPAPITPGAVIAPTGRLMSDIRPVNQAAPTPMPTVTSPSPPVLPPAAATHHEAMATMTRKQAEQLALGDGSDGKPKPLALAAAAFAVVIMGGYIWMQNYPKMALQAASNRAGFSATLPSYIPTSYNLSGPIDSSPGLISFKFGSHSSEPFTVTQRATNWDSLALLDNFVANKSNHYSAIEGQGLTVYLYDNNQASWINHGIWYTIEGATRLSREQVLKIAYSL